MLKAEAMFHVAEIAAASIVHRPLALHLIEVHRIHSHPSTQALRPHLHDGVLEPALPLINGLHGAGRPCVSPLECERQMLPLEAASHRPR